MTPKTTPSKNEAYRRFLQAKFTIFRSVWYAKVAKGSKNVLKLNMQRRRSIPNAGKYEKFCNLAAPTSSKFHWRE